MGSTHIVVDGSNIATEGRSLPSLQQLLEAVDAVEKDQNPETVTVIVDATFGHRIEKDERDAYEDKISNGEIITPPAGVIGRGDAFILEVADRADAVVLSNDSFQEFHGEYRWLFDEGRLLGGKHVPGVGWIFLDRSPVRGPASRKAISDAKRKRGSAKKGSSKKTSSTKTKKSAGKTSGSRKRSGSKKAQPAKASSRASGGKGKEPEPYNEPLPFIEFVGANEVGSVVEAEVEQFSSHGAYVLVGDTRCYVPLKAMGDPPPRSARDVLTQGEKRSFRVDAIDTPRRGIDLSLAEGPVTPPAEHESPEDAPAAARGTLDTDEPTTPRVTEADLDDPDLSVSQRRKLRAQLAAQEAPDAEAAAAPEDATPEKATGTTSARKKSTRKKSAGKKSAATKKSARRKSSTPKKSATKKAAAKKSTSRKKTSSRKTSATKKSAAKKSTGTKKTASKSRSAAKKSAAKKSTGTKKAASRKSAANKTAARKKSAPKKAAGKKSAAKKSAPSRRSRKS